MMRMLWTSTYSPLRRRPRRRPPASMRDVLRKRWPARYRRDHNKTEAIKEVQAQHLESVKQELWYNLKKAQAQHNPITRSVKTWFETHAGGSEKYSTCIDAPLDMWRSGYNYKAAIEQWIEECAKDAI